MWVLILLGSTPFQFIQAAPTVDEKFEVIEYWYPDVLMYPSWIYAGVENADIVFNRDFMQKNNLPLHL
ncbi:hypothetical protein EBB07_05320 [Paenibacillaceae bacterium]|nr:hypothetical protein EBB07_05320 [Paenibacillaceae bacterium]